MLQKYFTEFYHEFEKKNKIIAELSSDNEALKKQVALLEEEKENLKHELDTKIKMSTSEVL